MDKTNDSPRLFSLSPNKHHGFAKGHEHWTNDTLTTLTINVRF